MKEKAINDCHARAEKRRELQANIDSSRKYYKEALEAYGKNDPYVKQLWGVWKTAIAELVKMNYQALVSAIEAVKGHANSEELSEYWYEMHELLTKAQELLESGDQAAVDVCAKELEDLLAKALLCLCSKVCIRQ